MGVSYHVVPPCEPVPVPPVTPVVPAILQPVSLALRRAKMGVVYVVPGGILWYNPPPPPPPPPVLIIPWRITIYPPRPISLRNRLLFGRDESCEDGFTSLVSIQ